MKVQHYPELFVRHTNNPILTAADWPYPVHTVFNPGATTMSNGDTLLLCRAEDRQGMSHLTVARSADGITNWKIDSKPTLASLPDKHPEELWGVEDPRITYCPEEDLYLVAYTAFGKSGPGVAVATTKDFKRFKRYGLAMQADDKDAAFFPTRFDGNYAMIHRPTTEANANMWISFSPDLKNWGGHRLLMPARRGAWWDSNKIGLSTPPILTEKGWLIIYHAVRKHASGSIYRLGMALLDLHDPTICLLRSRSWIFGPEAPYEVVGDVPYVVFPCGAVVNPQTSEVKIYYGAADSSICLATGTIQELLAYLEVDGTNLTGTNALPEEIRILDPSA